MTTERKQSTLEFHGLSHRKLKAQFDGRKITSDAGVPMLGFCYCERWQNGRI